MLIVRKSQAGKAALFAWMLAFQGACGSKEDAEDTTSATPYTFEGHVAPILKASCAQNGACHEVDNNSGNTAFVAEKEEFIANKSEILDRINGRGGIMPQQGSGLTLSAANKAVIESYLGQTSQN